MRIIGPSPSGKAPGFDPGIRWFDKIAGSDFGRPQDGPQGEIQDVFRNPAVSVSGVLNRKSVARQMEISS